MTYESKLFRNDMVPAGVTVEFWAEAENIAIRQQNYLLGRAAGTMKERTERQYKNVCRWYELLKGGKMPMGLNWSACSR